MVGLLKFFKNKSNSQGPISTQTRTGYQHPFNAIDQYIPLKAEYELYKVMREAIPILDTAINRIIRLTGNFNIKCENDKHQAEMDDFINNIKVNYNQKGLNAFIKSYFDQLVESGNSSGEIILNNAKNDFYALKNVNIRSIKLKQTDNTLENTVCQVQEGKFEPVELPYQDLILFTPLDPEGDNPYGVSLFRSMPFMANILLKVFNSMGTNWERFGNVRYSVTYKPNSDTMDIKKVKERMKLIEDAFKDAMESNKRGKVKDFIGVGDIIVKVIGADNQVLDSEVPVKQVLEQLVAKTGLPPFLLGLSWSTTERMSQQQADFLTSELESYRDVITPDIKYIIDKWQMVTGKNIPYDIDWNDINLQDEVELARAALYKQQSENIKINNAIKKRNENIIDQQIAATELGYDKPAGDAPVTVDTSQPVSTQESNKRFNMNGAIFKSPFDSPPEDEGQNQIEQDTIKAYMKCVDRLESKILKLVPEPEGEGETKAFRKNKGLPDGYENKVKKAVDEFVKEMLGQQSGNDYGKYGTYLLNAFGYGIIRGNRTAKEEHGEEGRENNRERANYNHSYVQELLNNGMQLVKTKARDKTDDILLIMAEHAEVGDNPTVWARELRKQLSDSISGERWYWERLARSESAMAIDRGETAEYEAEGFKYVEWSCSSDACSICKSLDGQMWSTNEAPRVVEDTHPHCRCRKMPRTKRQYDEYIAA